MKKIDTTKLAWLDLEMTGLCPHEDYIMEVACIITRTDLEEVSHISLPVYLPEDILNSMGAWCMYHHTKSNLIQRCSSSNYSLREAEKITVDFLSHHFPATKPILCGNCLSQDRKFLSVHMPRLDSAFSHRIFDISSFRVAQTLWPNIGERNVANYFKKRCRHRCIQDLRDNIREIKIYRRLFNF